MKYLFYLAVIALIYRVFMRPKVIVEHRHFYDKKPKEDKDKPSSNAELADYEDVK
jgi:hypothetical protein